MFSCEFPEIVKSTYERLLLVFTRTLPMEEFVFNKVTDSTYFPNIHYEHDTPPKYKILNCIYSENIFVGADFQISPNIFIWLCSDFFVLWISGFPYNLVNFSNKTHKQRFLNLLRRVYCRLRRSICQLQLFNTAHISSKLRQRASAKMCSLKNHQVENYGRNSGIH